MAVKIGSNIASLMAQRRLGEATCTLAKVYERLSGGQRVNRASDDAAGLAIAKTLDANAKIFGQAIRNLNDGLSFTAIANGAMEALKGIVIRQRELAAQSSNGTYSDTQRQALDNEFQTLSFEYNRILEATSFNGRRVFSAGEGVLSLQGGIGATGALQAVFGTDRGASQNDTIRVSVAADGTQGNAISGDGAAAGYTFSADGRYVFFESEASNLLTGDTNGWADIFRKDLVTGDVVRVNVSATGAQGNSVSSDVSVSADGRYVAFKSYASNLAQSDPNGSQVDIFVKDLVTGEVKLVTTGVGGAGANGGSHAPSISADGRYVAFQSAATNLVTGGDSNGTTDVFVKDLVTGTITLASESGGTQGNALSTSPTMSADGRYVAFFSYANNLVPDTNNKPDIFVRDLVTGQLQRVSTGSDASQGDGDSVWPAFSSDGRSILFESYSTNWISGHGVINDVYRKDLLTGELALVSRTSTNGLGDGHSGPASFSPDGRYVVFHSSATNLVPGDTNGSRDIFVKDLVSGRVARVSLDSNGNQGNGDSWNQYNFKPVVSPDGHYIAFFSSASNLVAGDTNGVGDVFITGNPLCDWSVISRNDRLSVLTTGNALVAQTELDEYLNELDEAQGRLGAIEARLGSALSNLHSMTENFRSAESRIVDADVGQDAANLTRTRIVQQAASAVLAQANLQPQITLQLLQG